MGSLSRFLLGGAVGAAVGFLILRKRGKKSDVVGPRAFWQAEDAPTTVSPSYEAVPPPPEFVPSAQAESVSAVAPVAETVPPEEAVSPVEPEFVPEPVAELSPEPEPEAEPEPEPEAEPVPVVETQIEEGVIGEALTFEPDATASEVSSEMEESLDETELPPEAEEPAEVELNPHVLEEPIPGAGWEPSIIPLEEEDVDEVYPLPSVEEPSEIEVVAVAEPVAEEENVASAAPVPESPQAAPAISADDLKARIEETRRRIRRELDEPFVAEGGEPIEDGSFAVAESVPEIVVSESQAAIPEREFVPIAPEPSSEEPEPAPSIQEEVIPEEESAATEGAMKEPVDKPTGDETGLELGVDYEAIKSRIEETRSRLKAKAFDAMMTGESALLGRDAPGRTERTAPPELDQELAETIDTGLSEEEDV